MHFAALTLFLISTATFAAGKTGVQASTFANFISAVNSEEFDAYDSRGGDRRSVSPAEHLYAASGSFGSFVDQFVVKKGAGKSVLPATKKVLHLPRVSEKPASESRSATVKLVAGQLKVVPSTIYIPAVGEGISLNVDKSLQAAVSFFVRDESIAQWSAADSKVESRSQGDTEVFVVANGQMAILPIRVGHDPLALSVPKTLMGSGQWGIEQALVGSNRAVYAKSNSLTYDESIRQTYDSETKIKHIGNRVSVEKKEKPAKRLMIQFVDDRSNLQTGFVFPVGEVSARILGTDVLHTSSSLGYVTFDDLPVGGSFLLEFADPAGNYLPGVQEVRLSVEETEEVIRVKLLRDLIVGNYYRLFSFAQKADTVSVCLNFLNDEGLPLEGIKVSINKEDVMGPFYLKGRACYFNMAAGPLELDFRKDNDLVGSMVVPLISGHIEVEAIAKRAKFEFRPIVRASLEKSLEVDSLGSQFSFDEELQGELNVYALGENELMLPEASSEGAFSYENGFLPYNSRLYGMVENGDIGDMLFSMVSGRPVPVIPFHARGFIWDLHNLITAEDGVSYFPLDQSLGSAIVTFGHAFSDDKDGVDIDIQLIDQFGQLREGWVWSQAKEVTRAVFFNLEPGVYSTLAKSVSGYWLDMDTTIVEYETTSYTHLGAALVAQ